MGTMSINFAEIEGGFEPLPEGTYDCIIEKVEVRESKSSDNNYLNWEFKVTDDDHENQRLWMITSLSDRALFRLKDVFEALGVLNDEMDIEWDDDVEITPQEGPLLLNPDVVGLPCEVVVHNEMYDGKERNRVDSVVSTGAKPKAKKATAKKAPAKKKAAAGGRRRVR